MVETVLLLGLLVSVGGLGVFIVRQLAEMGRKSAVPTSNPGSDRVAELERMVTAYRGEVVEMQDRVERWFQRSEKRAVKDARESTDSSTGNPPMGVESKAELRRRLFQLRQGGR